MTTLSKLAPHLGNETTTLLHTQPESNWPAILLRVDHKGKKLAKFAEVISKHTPWETNRTYYDLLQNSHTLLGVAKKQSSDAKETHKKVKKLLKHTLPPKTQVSPTPQTKKQEAPKAENKEDPGH